MGMMDGTINIFGSKVPKPVAFGVGSAIIIGGVIYYRKNKEDAASSASVEAAGSTEIDPATGYPYGSAEDAAALASQGNYQTSSNIGGYGFSGYGGGSGASAFGSGAPGTFTNNAEWAQFVEAYEINNMGADGPAVGNAIGKYISGQPLTTDGMISIVQSAIAIGGYPPVSGPNGHPPGYVTSPTPTPTQPSSAVYASNPPAGLHVVFMGRSGGQIAWNKSANAKSYTVYLLGRGKFNTENTNANLGSLKPNTSYTVQVWANPTPTGGPHSTKTFKTAR